MELMRWSDASLIRRKPGFIAMRLIPPDNDKLKILRLKRLLRAFSDKCPKLKRCKHEGARTVLILESVESVLTRFDHIGHHLPTLLADRTDAPDEIYLVQTDKFGWWVYPIKRDGGHWPCVGGALADCVNPVISLGQLGSCVSLEDGLQGAVVLGAT